MRKRKAAARDTISGIILLILVFALVVGLTLVALSRAKPHVDAAGQTPGYAQSAAELNPAGESQSGSTSADAVTGESFTVAPARRVLTALDAATAYRAYTDTCPDASAKLSRSGNGGQTWETADLGEAFGVSAVQRIISGVDGYVGAIAMEADACTQAQALTSFDGGAQWEVSGEALGQSWFIDPSAPSTIHTPQGTTTSAPCDVARLAPAGVTDLAIGCADGRVFTSPDGGVAWEGGAMVSGLDSLAAAQSGLYIAALVPECSGVQVTVLDWSLNEISGQCVGDADAKPGRTAISVGTDGSVWLWAGENMHRSVDDTATWVLTN